MGLTLSLISRQKRLFSTGSRELQAPEGLRAVRDKQTQTREAARPPHKLFLNQPRNGWGLGPAPGSPASPHPGRRAPGLSLLHGTDRRQGPPGWAPCWGHSRPTLNKCLSNEGVYPDLPTALLSQPLQRHGRCLEMPFPLQVTVHAGPFTLPCGSCSLFIKS